MSIPHRRPRTVATLRICDRLVLHPGAQVRFGTFALDAPDLRAWVDLVIVPSRRKVTLSARVDVRAEKNTFVSYAELTVLSPGCSSLRIPSLDGRALRVVVRAGGSTPVKIHLLSIRLVQAA